MNTVQAVVSLSARDRVPSIIADDGVRNIRVRCARNQQVRAVPGADQALPGIDFNRSGLVRQVDPVIPDRPQILQQGLPPKGD
nr:hypothetical protein [Thalassovita taeanensis]